MKNVLWCVAVLGLSLGSVACVEEEAPDASRPSALDRGAEEGDALGHAVEIEPGAAKAPETPTARCSPRVEGVVLESVRAVRLDQFTIDVDLRGVVGCDRELDGFRFSVFNAEEIDISGRSWPELDSVALMEDGSFRMHAKAVGCSDYSSAERIVVQLAPVDGDVSNALEVAIEEPRVVAAGVSCEAFGVTCAEGSWCGLEGVCE